MTQNPDGSGGEIHYEFIVDGERIAFLRERMESETSGRKETKGPMTEDRTVPGIVVESVRGRSCSICAGRAELIVQRADLDRHGHPRGCTDDFALLCRPCARVLQGALDQHFNRADRA